MAEYITIQGDTWDAIAYRLYGDESYMKDLIEANRPHIDTMVFPSGTVLQVPEMVKDEEYDAPFWREDDSDEDMETFSPTEGGDDDE